MPFGLGLAETLLIVGVVILFFGAKRLPEAAASLGKGIREFKGAVSGMRDEIETPANTISAPPPPAQATSAAPASDPNVIAAPAPGRTETFSPSAAEPVVHASPESEPPRSTPAATDRP
ncbi:MAG TPA: twin-arginine translocase TatA/TatE family subunit [Longimicrobium sp.]|nr:twin-arginine translocase TatA/TatE family subunit [Longimicrobium sp.]